MVNTKYSYNAINLQDAFCREVTCHSFAVGSGRAGVGSSMAQLGAGTDRESQAGKQSDFSYESARDLRHTAISSLLLHSPFQNLFSQQEER